MATQFSTQTYTIPDGRVYGSQQPSPASSASPTSSRINDYLQNQPPNPNKQLRPLKSPLYVPAVLRPTEHFSMPSPMTPPKSLHGSLDDLQNGSPVQGEESLQEHLIEAFDPHWLQEEDLGDVTGPPTREHWKPDEASPTCDSPQCRSSFNLFIRKHHCRHCGHIFCSSHTLYTIPLDQYAKFHPDGIPSRACDTCYRQFQRWDTARSLRRKNSENSKDDDESGPPTPLTGTASHRRMISANSRGGKPVQHAVGSVPKTYDWGTF